MAKNIAKMVLADAGRRTSGLRAHFGDVWESFKEIDDNF